MVWGCDARTFRNGDPNAIKYPWTRYGLDRWIFETWSEPFCSPDEWELARYKYFEEAGQTIDMFGPYPHEGIWGMKMPLISSDPREFGAYMPCSQAFLDWLRMNHHAWLSAPTGAYASLDNYNRMMEQMAQEEKERQAEVDKAVEDHISWTRAHADEINAADTRVSVLITPDGQPWKRETLNAN